MDRTYCFGCGAEVPTPTVPGVAVCPNCRFEAQEQGHAWMARHGDQRPQGPLTRQTVEERIQRGTLAAGDQIARVDGPWRPIEIHEDFRAWFTPGDPRLQERLASIQARRRSHVVSDWRARGRLVLLLLGTAGALAASGWAWKVRLFVVPEPWIQASSERAGGTWDRVKSLWGSARSAEEAARAIQAQADLPGEDVVRALTPSPVRVPARLAWCRARAAMLAAPVGVPDEAVALLESAVAADPRDPVAVAALAEAWAASLDRHPERNEATLALISRADALDPEAPATWQARATLAQASRAWPDALELADRCLAVDPDNLACTARRAAALDGLDRHAESLALWTRLVERLPHAPRYVVALARAEAHEGRYRSSRDRLDALVAAWPAESAILALSAEVAWQTGDWPTAARHGAAALEGDPSDLATRIVAARGALAVGDPASAIALLTPAVGVSGDRDPSRTVLLLLSHARRQVGDLAGAQEAAKAVLAEERSSGPAALALALARVQGGDLPGAESALKEAFAEDLPPSDAAAFHVVLGRVYLDQARPNAAIAAFERALEVDPASVQARLGLAETFLSIANGPKALAQIRAVATSVVEADAGRPPVRLCPLPPRDPARIVAGLAEIAARDPSSLPAAQAALGIVAWASGDTARAEAALAAALAADPNDTAARAMQGRLALAGQRWSQAEAWLSPLLVNPENEALWSALLGQARSGAGRHAEAIALLRRAVALSDETGAYHRLLAEALYRSGDATAALEQARRAWTLDPQDHLARRLALEHGPRPAGS